MNVMKSTICTEIKENQVIWKNQAGDESVIDTDTVILAVGMVSLTDTVNSLREVSDEFRWIGDCKKPRHIGTAIHEAYDASMSI